MLKNALVLSSLLLASSAYGESTALNYKSFYDRLKTVNKNNYGLVDIAFSVPNIAACKIQSGSIRTEKKSYPLTISKDQRLLLPYNERLKQDRALIHLELAGAVAQCGIKMQIISKLNNLSYSQLDLKQIENEMNALLKDLQGFPVKYFSEPIDGITFNFATQEVKVKIDGKMKYVANKFQLPSKAISNLTKLSFSHKPITVSPWVK
ncbi:MAG: DUF2987 domain-containing protein [Parashewanella sp.]